MSASPYLITGPALISFSGGRTSGFMLRQILDAHGGTLPPDVHVAFANTGKERPETLRFVHECGSPWGIRVRWLEWRPGNPGFEEVGYNSASRSGEPFAALIRQKGFLPNAVARFCTQELKIRAMRDFALGLGWERWVNAVGLRYDEGHRVLKALARNDENKERFKAVMPMAKAKHSRQDVMAFWAEQPFDLGLRSYEGNCDLCFRAATEVDQARPGFDRVARLWFNALTGEDGVVMHDGSVRITGPAEIVSLDWVITGGETDQGSHKARPTHPAWFRSLRDQCAAARLPYHHKQNGEWAAGWSYEHPGAMLDYGRWLPLPPGNRMAVVYRVGKRAAGRLLDGATHDALPVAIAGVR